MTRAHAKFGPAALVESGYARNALLLPLTTILLLTTQNECASREGPSVAAGMVIEARRPAQIVTGPEPTLTEEFAAGELARYIRAMTGKEIPVRTDGAPLAGVTLAVGVNKYSRRFMSRFGQSVAGPGPDSFVVSAKDGLVVLAGGADRGTLYSVYEFLEGQGCRWFFPGELGEYVPKKDRLVVPEGEKLCVPDFVQREIDGGTRDPKRMLEIVDWAAKNRINRIFGIRAYHLRAAPPGERNAWAKRGGTIKWQWICHNLSWMIPPEEFKEHPKYFALYKGERVPIGTKGRRSYGGGNLCTTNEDVIRTCADFCIDWFDKNPDGAVVPINPNDGAVKWCECDNCRKLGGINFMGGRKGSMTRRMITFTNAIARRVYRRHPDRFLLLLAYSNYIEPEPAMNIEENVIVQYAAHLDYAHAPDGSAANEKARRQMEIWAKQANGNFGIWEYYLLGDFRSKKAPPVWLPLVYRTRDTVRYYKSLGARFYFTQSNYRYWDHNALVWYTLARLIWKTDTDFDALADDFFAKMYGPAARPVKELYRLVEESAQRSDWCPTIYSAVAEPSPKVFTRAVLERGEALLRQAEGCKLDDKQRRRVALVRESFDFGRGNLRVAGLSGLDAGARWRVERREHFYLLNADGNETSKARFDEIVRNALDAGMFTENFERVVFRARKRKCPVVFLENERLKLALLPGIGGRIIRIIDKRTGWNFLKEPKDIDSLDAIGGPYFNYGGYEEYMGKPFAAPGWEREYTYRLASDARSKRIVLRTEADGLALERTVTLAKGASGRVDIVSVLTNTGAADRRAMLRVHPAMDLGPGPGSFVVHLRKQDGTFKRSTTGREFESVSFPPQGLWAVVNESKNIGIANSFSPEEASVYLFFSEKEGAFNMELFGKEQTLAPGESLMIRHAIHVMSDAEAEWPKLAGAVPVVPKSPKAASPARTPKLKEKRSSTKAPLKRGAEGTRVRPLEGVVVFEKGKVGRCARFNPKSHLTFDSKYIKGNAGTVEAWVELAADATDEKLQFLFAVGANNPDWFMLTIGAGKIGFLYKNGRSPYQGRGQFYSYLHCDVRNLEKGSWHHVAYVWGYLGKAKSLKQIYLDGRLKAENYQASIGDDFRAKTLCVGYGGVRKMAFTGALDELRISNYPKTAGEIAASFEAGLAGKPLGMEQGTLLLLNFEGPAEARSATTGQLDNATVQKKIEAIIDRL